jgi:hypothetical protein
MQPSSRGLSKKYINLVIGSKHRELTHSLFEFLHPSFVTSLFEHLHPSLVDLFNCKYSSEISSCQVQSKLYFKLHRLQFSSAKFLVQFLTVHHISSGNRFLLKTLNFNCNRTKLLFRIPLFFTFFNFNGLNFEYHLFIHINLFNLPILFGIIVSIT